MKRLNLISKAPWQSFVRWISLIVCLAFIAGAAMISGYQPAQAQTGGAYDLARSTITGGGITSGGAYELNGATGQADAGEMNGGVYTLGGGFWGGGVIATGNYGLFLPLVLR